MGDLLSKPEANPSDSNQSNPTSSLSQNSQTLESKPEQQNPNPNPNPKSPETQTPIHASDQPSANQNETLEKDQEGEEEEGECGFCLFMKAGGCRDSFIAWENCVKEAETKKEDIVEKCSEMTGLMMKCMQAHPEHYGPIMEAEKAMEEAAAKELEKLAEEAAAKELEKLAEEAAAVGQMGKNSGEKGSPAAAEGQSEKDLAEKGSG